jgi:transposase
MARQRIVLVAEEAEELSRRSRATTVSVRDRQRAETILLSAQGLTQQRIAEQLGISRLAVNRWVGRFALRRLEGLSDRGGRGRKPWLPQAAVQQVLQQAVTPPPHLARWSCRTMARAAAISPASVQRLWAASDIKPHLSRTFKLSTDQRFEEKFWDGTLTLFAALNYLVPHVIMGLGADVPDPQRQTRLRALQRLAL